MAMVGGIGMGELVTTTLEIIWTVCLFLRQREKTFFEKNLKFSHGHLFDPPPSKVNIFQASPLLVKCQAYNTTLKFQQRVVIFFFFFPKQY